MLILHSNHCKSLPDSIVNLFDQSDISNDFSHFHSSIFPFSNNQVRIVLYRECDMKGRRLLFDSSAIQKVHLEATPIKDDKNGPNPNGKCHKNYIEVSNGYGYRYARPEMDYNTIGEMIFGSVAMSFRGTSLKVNRIVSHTNRTSYNHY